MSQLVNTKQSSGTLPHRCFCSGTNPPTEPPTDPSQTPHPSHPPSAIPVGKAGDHQEFSQKGAWVSCGRPDF